MRLEHGLRDEQLRPTVVKRAYDFPDADPYESFAARVTRECMGESVLCSGGLTQLGKHPQN